MKEDWNLKNAAGRELDFLGYATLLNLLNCIYIYTYIFIYIYRTHIYM